MYADHEAPIKEIKDLWGVRTFLLVPLSKKEEEYAGLLNIAKKMTGRGYMELHKQMEKNDVSLGRLREWVYAAEKSDNKGKCFNGLLKYYKSKKKVV